MIGSKLGCILKPDLSAFIWDIFEGNQLCTSWELKQNAEVKKHKISKSAPSWPYFVIRFKNF